MSTRMDFVVAAHDRASKVFLKVAAAAQKLSGTVDRMKAVGKFAAIGGAAAVATPHLLAVAAALAKVGPAAAVAIPALIAGGVAMATLKLATAGMSDALGNLGRDAASMEKFAEAIKGLAPNARAFAVAVRRVAPAFTEMRKAVQNTAFAGLAAQIKPITSNLLPTLRHGLVGVAEAGNTAARGLAGFLRTGQAKSLLGTTLTGIVSAFKGMSGLPAKLGKALLQIAVAAMPAFQRLTGAMTGFFTRFAEKVNNKSVGGKLTATINEAIDALKQLGRVAGNIGSAIGGIFKAAGDGTGLLSSLERITKAISDAVNSKKGQEVLQKVFEMLAKAGPIIAVAGGLSLVVGAIGSALAAVAAPATAVALGVTAVGAAFVYLYTRSAALREIVAGVGSKLRELWDLFVAKGLPIVKEFTEKALGTAIAGFNSIRDAIQRNRPELEQLWAGVKKVAAFIMASWPAMSTVAIATLTAIFAGLTNVINVIGAAVRWFNFLKGAVTAVAAVMLASFSAILGGLARFAGAMAKVPGMGSLWTPVVNAANTARNAIDRVSDAIDGIPRIVPVTFKLRQEGSVPRTVGNTFSTGRIGGMAKGGPVTKGTPYIVGEKRPELFVPNQSGRIVPRVPAMSGGGALGGGRMSLEVSVAPGADNRLMAELVRQLRYTVRIEGGGNVQTAFGG